MGADSLAENTSNAPLPQNSCAQFVCLSPKVHWASVVRDLLSRRETPELCSVPFEVVFQYLNSILQVASRGTSQLVTPHFTN